MTAITAHAEVRTNGTVLGRPQYYAWCPTCSHSNGPDYSVRANAEQAAAVHNRIFHS